ncbi:hypothetical protein [Enterococcus gallinarum]|uniref:hypothetical protein n=1 Tax=Enterococcus gallinarum TaxID=1353 RepID=UPI002890B401|nr:hypothetical protein [Enterococcus gallinarum]MDT2685813.1 hypothetical protein [Enterococcus gallinarum]
MNFEEMKIDSLKEYLDNAGIDYTDAKKKADYVALAKENAIQADSESSKKNSVAELVKTAIRIEKETVKTVDDPLAYLKDRDYSQLSVGERVIIREQSPEYKDVENGVQVKITDRLTTKHRIVRLADKRFSKLIKGATYTMAQADFDLLNGSTVKVKTIATQNKCCGQARYEDVALFEVTND